MLPMTLAAALELVLNQYGIFDVDDLVAILRSPVDATQVADLINESREQIDATAHTAHVSRQCADRDGDSDGGHNNGQHCQRA